MEQGSAEDEWQNLELMTDDQIDYSLLPEVKLSELATGSDLYVAGSALRELERRSRTLAAGLAKDILTDSVGDAYLQAIALRILYENRPDEAVEYMLRHVPETPTVLLNKMMDLLAAPGEDERPPSDEEWAVARLIAKRLHYGSTENGLIRSDVAEMFSARFPID